MIPQWNKEMNYSKMIVRGRAASWKAQSKYVIKSREKAGLKICLDTGNLPATDIIIQIAPRLVNKRGGWVVLAIHSLLIGETAWSVWVLEPKWVCVEMASCEEFLLHLCSSPSVLITEMRVRTVLLLWWIQNPAQCREVTLSVCLSCQSLDFMAYGKPPSPPRIRNTPTEPFLTWKWSSSGPASRYYRGEQWTVSGPEKKRPRNKIKNIDSIVRSIQDAGPDWQIESWTRILSSRKYSSQRPGWSDVHQSVK